MALSKALELKGTRERPRVDRELRRLVGSRCTRCRAVSWPSRALCQRCGSPDLQQLLFSPHGQLVTFTRVHVPRPGLPTPYVLGQVDLPEGVRIFAHLRGLPPDASGPARVVLVISSEEGSVPAFWFEPEE